jgi:hypothetical protein
MYFLANDAVIADDPALGIAAFVLMYMQVIACTAVHATPDPGTCVLIQPACLTG